MIEMYNDGKPTELKHLPRVIGNRIRMQGFIGPDFMHRAGEFYREMGALRADGRLTGQETVHEGLEAAPAAFLGLFSGGNTGKMLVRVQSPPVTPA